MDSVINTQKGDIQAAQSAAVSSNGELQSKVKQLETQVEGLSGQVTKKADENKKLREEIDKLKEELKNNGNPSGRSRKIQKGS